MSSALRALASAFLACLATACQPATPGALGAAPRQLGGDGLPERPVVFRDRTHEATYRQGRVHLAEIRAAVNAGVSPAQSSELGFRCAGLRSDQKALLAEDDPLVVRLVADVDKLCGLDFPIAAAQAELRAIEAKRRTGASTKSECLGLKLALGDLDAKYASNPAVAEIGGKYATSCSAE